MNKVYFIKNISQLCGLEIEFVDLDLKKLNIFVYFMYLRCTKYNISTHLTLLTLKVEIMLGFACVLGGGGGVHLSMSRYGYQQNSFFKRS